MCSDGAWYESKNGADQKAVKHKTLFFAELQELIMEDYLYRQPPSFHHYAVREQLILSKVSNNLWKDMNVIE